MRYFIWVFLICLLVSSTAEARSYKLKCINQMGKFASCNVELTNDFIRVSYRKKSNSMSNAIISTRSIKGVTLNEYKPLPTLIVFRTDLEDHIGLSYDDHNGQLQVITFRIKKKYGAAFRNDLEGTSKKKIGAKGKTL